MPAKKGFTLIEILVVIGLVAVLSLAIVLLLNPAELLKQSRDSSRLTDMGSIKRAISLYLTSVTVNPNIGAAATCYASNSTTTAQCGGVFGAAYSSTNATTSRGVSGTDGWLPVNFRAISSGAPFGSLPIDPVNNATYYYAYAASTTNLTFEIDAALESVKYSNGGAKDAESTDGGNNANWYEAGTVTGLSL